MKAKFITIQLFRNVKVLLFFISDSLLHFPFIYNPPIQIIEKRLLALLFAIFKQNAF